MSGGGTTTTDQSGGPSKLQAPYLNQAFGQAANLFANYTPQYYGGEQVAPFNPNQVAGQTGGAAYANGGAQTTADNILGAENTLTNGSLLNANSNPYMAGSVGAALQPIQQNFMNQVLPQITDQAVGSGNINSSRAGIAQGNAIQDYLNTEANTTSSMYSTAYQNGLQAMLQGVGQGNNALQAGAAPSNMLSAIGSQQQQQQQNVDTSQMQEYEWQQMLPYMQLAQFMSTIGGDWGGSGTSSATSPSSLFEKLTGSSGVLL